MSRKVKRRRCVPEELVLGAEGLGTVRLRAVEGLLPRVAQAVEAELLLGSEQSPADQTLVSFRSSHLLLLFPPLSLSLRPWQRGGAPEQLGGGAASLFLRRQCGDVV